MIAIANVPMTGLSELVWAGYNFWYLKHLVKDDSWEGYTGYVLASVIGCTGTVYLTKP